MGQVNKRAIAAAFGRAAAHYEQHATLQRLSADALLAQLPERPFLQVLDAGCGPGRLSRYWRELGVRLPRWISLPACWTRRVAVTWRITISPATLSHCR